MPVIGISIFYPELVSINHPEEHDRHNPTPPIARYGL
nr:MAG TPA: hypothetical protein [Caudoviricetes sp.]